MVLTLLWQGLLLAVAAVFPEPSTASFGTLEVGERVEAAFFRWEALVAAPRAGSFRREQPERERIPRLGVIGTLTTRDRPPERIRAGYAGLVAYTCDSLDRPVKAEQALADPRAAFLVVDRARMRPTVSGAVHRGEPVARLVRDQEQYVVARLRGNRAPVLAGGEAWAKEQDGLVPMTVVKTVSERGNTWVVLRTDRFPPAWLDQRRSALHLLWLRYSGTLVPRRYLRRRDGKAGVLAMTGGRVEFVPVEVVGQDHYQAAVRGVSAGTMLMPR